MYITKSKLSNYRADKFRIGVTKLGCAINSLNKAVNPNLSRQNTIFLSHKHDEGEILEQSVTFIESHGVNVFIDWQDDEMPSKTSGETAVIIKNKISECTKFILLATNKAIESKWCNWELGFGDSIKFPSNLAIFPIAENDGSWEGNEYLQIYPTIQQLNDTLFYVVYDGKFTHLKEWLTT